MLAAFEALQSLSESGQTFDHHVEVISFTDEEGAVLSLFGSRAIAGLLTDDDLRTTRTMQVLDESATRVGVSRSSAMDSKRDDLLAFLELHIEQGTRLQAANLDVGLVTSIVGIRSYWLTFTGEAAHAGTMPMDHRRDGLWGAAAFIQQARDKVMADFHPGVMN